MRVRVPYFCLCQQGDVRALPYLDDPDIAELSNRIIEKLRNMTDEDFERLELIEAE